MAIKQYKLQKKISESPSVDVYLGLDTKTDRPISMKVLKTMDCIGDVPKKRLYREFDAVRSIESPHVTPHLEIIETSKFSAIVTPGEKGVSLSSFMAMNHPLKPDTVISVARQIAAGLAACHNKGVVHRNLTPLSIFVSEENSVSLTGFGMASIESVETLTMTGEMFGEIEYSPPETLLAASRDLRVDIYSFGIILWEMLTGTNPFTGKPISEIIGMKSTGEIPLSSTLREGIPRWLDELVSYCVESSPRQRPVSFSEIIFWLDGKQRPHGLWHKNKQGRCFSCGYSLTDKLSFCHFCGKAVNKEYSDDEVFVLAIQKTSDKNKTAEFLKDTMTLPPQRPLNKALNKLPVPVVQGISKSESSWFIEELQKTGATSKIISLPSLYFKLSSEILFLSIFIMYVFFEIVDFFILPFDRESLLKFIPDTDELILKQELRLLLIVFMIYLCIRLLIIVRKHYAPVLLIPGIWLRGARGEHTGTGKNLTSVITSFRLVGTVIACFIIGNIACLAGMQLVKVVAYVFGNYNIYNKLMLITGPIFNESLDVDPYYAGILEYTLERSDFSHDFLMLLIFVSLLVIAKIVVGRNVNREPLYSHSKLNNETSDAVSFKSNSALFKDFKKSLQGIRHEEFRYLIADAIESFLHFEALKTKFAKALWYQELKLEVTDVVIRISKSGQGIKPLLESMTREAVNQAEQKMKNIRVTIQEAPQPITDSLKDRLRNAQDELFTVQAAGDEVAEQLNYFKSVCGSLKTLVLQAAKAGTTESDHETESLKNEMLVLSEELKTLTVYLPA